MDDWKKRRREKAKMPPPRTSNNGDFNDDEQQQQQPKTDRKRINKFENSHYYLQPYDDENNPIEIKTENQENNNIIATTQSATIEITGVRNYDHQTSSGDKQIEIKNQLNESIKQQQLQQKQNDEVTKDEISILNLTNYTFVERVVNLVRTDDYNLRGFGFLLKNASKKLVNNTNSQISFTMSQNYAEIVGLDPRNYQMTNN